MSLDKAIKYGKEHRKIYYGLKAIDSSCRCHGSCSYCLSNRMYRENKNKEKVKYSISELFTEYTDDYIPEKFDWGKDVGNEII